LTPYSGLAKELVHHTKYERAQSGAREMAHAMAGLVSCFPRDAVLVAVPTATSRVRSRGYDHASLLCRQLSRISGIPYARLLMRTGQAHQVGSNRTQRLRQLEGAFRAPSPHRVHGRTIVLVDDVVTTGASLEAAARVLRAHGAKQIDAVVFAQV
jgi:ComF family protein